MNLTDHLLSRGLDPRRYHVILDDEKGVATFLLWNLAEQLVGYQQYNPLGSKELRGTEKNRNDLKYFTFVGYEGDPAELGGQKRAERRIGLWGTETLAWAGGYTFITEGIFDAVKVHNAGHPCLAVLANDPQQLRPFFVALGRIVFPVIDRDAAGARLAKFGDLHLVPPEPYKDLGEMSQEDVDRLIGSFLRFA